MSKLNVAKALTLLFLSFFIIFTGVLVVKAPSVIVLIFAGMVTIALSMAWGIKWDDIQNDIYDNLRSMFPAILILLSVGMLVGAWILAGTVPLMVYYGLKILTPSTFLISAALICAAMSVMAGTSWGTISTVGVALMGVSTGLGVPLHMTAGAIVVGAIFGDKLSPLSDTTVLAAAVSDVELVDHIKYMLYTTIPGFVISLGLYTILGFRFSSGSVSGESLDLILSTLENTFTLNPVLLLPPILVLFLIYKKYPTLPVFAVGIIFGSVLAFIFQTTGSFSDRLLTIASALNGGYSQSTGVGIVDSMLIRGGLRSMLGTVALLIGAVIFGSPLRTAGVIGILINYIKSVAKSGKAIMLSSFSLHGLMFLVTGSYYVTFSVLGPILKPLYSRFGLHPKNLSRTLEDTGTALAPIVPWSVTGVFIVDTLGVETGKFFLYAPMTYLGLVFGLIYIVTNFKIATVETHQEVDTLSA
ncbi:Na+/H+ antiporter NhaC [Alkalicella caledoniensis]|uniref:Na+/H+ antiporter NhaC n=1 Tax=Alkalicella caledoniensis TaxID=2731377 RepID=A0A7G9WAP7_ALKCA|nr:Na+/H+ antiporter NhaC [Alkalicella caledoniensis]QNO15759.1 Na+/H+ antiporter NhaC [Alkalicella caledoniensis]